jgi:hypothetical protein
MFRNCANGFVSAGERLVGGLFGVFECAVLLLASVFSLGDLWRLHKIRSQ